MKIKMELSDKLSPKQREVAEAVVNDENEHTVILTTNKLEVEKDRKDERYIAAIKNVKMIYEVDGGGCLILKGKLGCSFREPYGGSFYVVNANIDYGTKFDAIQGVHRTIKISGYPTSINDMENELQKIVDDGNFCFNMTQFDEFIHLFNFYKKLSAEINNSKSYKIVSKVDDKNNAIASKPYYFVPISVKDIEVEDSNQIINIDGVLAGYRLEDYKYEQLSSEQQSKVMVLYDVKIDQGKDQKGLVKKFRDRMYLSDYDVIDERNVKELVQFVMEYIYLEGKNLVIAGELGKGSDKSTAKKSNLQYRFLNLYDMGQKIKVESIDQSLKLINQGASGSAAQLLEYIIGDEKMLNNVEAQQRNMTIKKQYIQDLDESQRQAFLMATDGSPVSLIKGPPGTGKTHVINAIVQYITKELGEKVVISSQTHVAIDNVLDALMSNYDLIIPNRITNRRNKYSGSEIDVTLYKTWASKFNDHNKRSQNQQLATQIQKDMTNFAGDKQFRYSLDTEETDYSVIGATTTTSAIGGKKGLELLQDYKWLIIDEVSKCPITEVLRYLPYVDKIIMVGDDYQLAPLLEFTREDVKDLAAYNDEDFERLKAVYEQSVFAKTLSKAREAGRLVELNVNYRSVNQVLQAYNIFYDGRLESRREQVKPHKVTFNNKNTWNEHDIFFVEVKGGREAKSGTSRYNIEEISATATILQDLISKTEQPEKVTVSAIFPYSAQIERFQKENIDLINTAKKTFKLFELDTVDAFQGRESDIVLVNTVVTDQSQRNFLNDFRRINVSMSRAKDKLFIFGNSRTLSKIEMSVSNGAKRRFFNDIIDDIRRHGVMMEYVGGEINESTSESKIKIK